MNHAAEKHHNQVHWDAMVPRWKTWVKRLGPPSQVVSEHLLAQSGVGPGARVLDLATGLGEPAFTFARRVGPQGAVLGVDQASQMIAAAREQARDLDLPQLRFEVQDIEALQLQAEAPFDAIVSRWGLMFCADLQATLDQFPPLLKPGGCLVAAVWGPAERVPMLSLAAAVLKATLDRDIRPPGPGPFDLADPALLETALGRAGFQAPVWESVSVSFFCDSAADYLQARAGSSQPLEQALAEMSAAERQRFDTALAAALEPWRQDQGYLLVNEARCLRAVLSSISSE
ncbi:MAG: class I SAM-dependent methyltransferase [Candidatus Sericytochromatia bacterium]